ncbi:MAG: VWA domain-containing protein [Planctomycetota bacterium]|nr:MAG: VWA domain-containing protein [Planctomycetota bacterium]
MNAFRLHDPLWLLALPAMAGLWWWLRKRQKPPAAVYSSALLLQALPRSARQRWAWLPAFLSAAGLVCLVLALCRPQMGLEAFRIRREGVAILMAVDRSNSMAALDFEWRGQPATRLEVAKKVMDEFVSGNEEALEGRADDWIGLVAFGGFAESLAPLTLDHPALLDILEQVELPLVHAPVRDEKGRVVNREVQEQEGATAIGDAIGIGVERLRHHPAKSKVLVLLSDGKQTAGVLQPMEAAAIAKEFGVKIHTIGIGTTGMVPVLLPGPGGRQQIGRDYFELDEKTLQAVAKETDGRYFNAKNTQALREVYQAIDALEKTELEGQIYSQYAERAHWFLFPALLLLALSAALQQTIFRETTG